MLVLRNRRAAISGLVAPVDASAAIVDSCGVSSVAVSWLLVPKLDSVV